MGPIPVSGEASNSYETTDGCSTENSSFGDKSDSGYANEHRILNPDKRRTEIARGC